MIDSYDHSYLIIALTGTYFLWRRYRSHLKSKKPFDDLPMVPNSHLLLGHMWLLGRPFQEYFEILRDNANENGHTGYWMGSTASIAVTKWEDARKVYLNESYRKNIPVLTHHLSSFIGRYNILNLMGKEWKAHRSAITKAFLPVHNAEYQKIMVQVTQTFVHSIREKLLSSPSKNWEMDVEPLMKMVTVDVFGLAALDTDFGCCKNLKSDEFSKSFDFLSSECSRRLKRPLDPFCLFYGLPNESNRQHAKAFQKIRSFCEEKIQQKRATTGSNDLISRIIEGQLEAKERVGGVSNEVVTDVLMSLQFAGYETTSLALVYALYCIDRHPEVEENCFREIESLDGLTNPDDLIYCTGVVMETLRLYPPAFITARYLQKPLELSGGYVAPKGAVILNPIWALHRNKDTWPQPETFRPDRWVKRGGDHWVERGNDDTKDSDIAPANRKAFFGFGAGGRSCPGQAFALQESVLVLAGLLKEFKFRVQPGYKPNPVRDGVVQHPEHGMPMTIELRNKRSS